MSYDRVLKVVLETVRSANLALLASARNQLIVAKRGRAGGETARELSNKGWYLNCAGVFVYYTALRANSVQGTV